MNYKVADFIIRIKNIVLARRRTVIFPYAKMTKSLAELMVREGYLKDVKEIEKEGKKMLQATIAVQGRVAVFTDASIISKPSLRVYADKLQLEKVRKKAVGEIIVSTSQGLMMGKEALKKGLGGELLLRIW